MLWSKWIETVCCLSTARTKDCQIKLIGARFKANKKRQPSHKGGLPVQLLVKGSCAYKKMMWAQQEVRQILVRHIHLSKCSLQDTLLNRAQKA